jgi:conjugal transfer pilus assembly protein TrbC
MKFYWLIILFLLSSTAVADEDYLADALEAKSHAKDQVALYRNEIEKLQSVTKTNLYAHEIESAENQSKKILEQYRKSHTAYSIKKTASSILIFVSFSMPKQSLETYLRDAKKINASVVIRGLIDNSFQKTAQRMAELIRDSDGGVELNPIWFKRFGIEKVPAIVAVAEGSRCFSKNTCDKKNDFDVITGDISLSYALHTFSNENKLTGSIPKAALRKLEGHTDE